MARLYFELLVGLGIYTVYSTAISLLHLRSAEPANTEHAKASPQYVLGKLQARCANLRHVIGAASYLFGLIFFLMLPLATHTPDSRIPLGILILNNFLLYANFAANVFIVLLVLHLVQWFVSARVHAALVRVCK